MNTDDAFHPWINYVFDHPFDDPPWYHVTESLDDWAEAPENVVNHISKTFERSGDLLARFSDEQLNQGCWYLFYHRPPVFMESLLDGGIALPIRLRTLRSFVQLFKQVMAVRCSSHLSHLDEKQSNVLNSACYMWFDELLDRFNPQRLVDAQLDVELAITLRDILAIPHDACRESALHGIGHWVREYPQLTDVVDQFLANSPGLRPELVTYAEFARSGNVL